MLHLSSMKMSLALDRRIIEQAFFNFKSQKSKPKSWERFFHLAFMYSWACLNFPKENVYVHDRKSLPILCGG